MTNRLAIKQVRSGERLMLGDFFTSGGLTKIRILCLTPEQLLTMPEMARLPLLVATRAFIELLVGGDERLSTDFLGGESVSEDEIVGFMKGFLSWAGEVWAVDARFAKDVVRSLETAQMCLVYDSNPDGFVSSPRLFVSEFSGNATNLIPDPAPLGRLALVSIVDGQAFLSDNGFINPEGGVVSFVDFQKDASPKD